MKNKHKISIAALAGLVFAGCADTDIDVFQVDKPQSLVQYEYLDAYGSLKEYIDRSKHPGFLLGTGVSATDYVNGTLAYRVTNANFDQMTAGNEMKYASIVGDDGTMDFSLVEKFVEAAKAAGMQIYGHTLCWHEQQNVKWLNSLIADREMEVDPSQKEEVSAYLKDYSKETAYSFWAPDEVKANISINKEEGCFELVNNEAIDNWMVQYHVADGLPISKDKDYKLKIMVRASGEGTLSGKVGDWGSGHEFNIPLTTEWEENVIDFKSQTDGGFVLLQSGQFVGTIQIKYVEVTYLETPVMKVYLPLISGGDGESGECEGLIARYPGLADAPAKVVDDPAGTGKVYVAEYNADPTNAWDSQFFIKSNTVLNEGDRVRVSFRYRCTDARNIDTQAHGEPGSYHHWQFIGTLNATTEWQEHSWTGAITADHAKDGGCKSIAFNISSASPAGQFYIDDVKFELEKSTNMIEMTPEEKAQVLTDEMERWVKGMMEATGGYVTAWDVVNEAISGNWKDGRYDLQHAATASGDQSNKFYWQDYLGDDFVRVPVKYARQYFEENGGSPADLKLFINDYNLESDWDDNQKLKSLINWIEQWESDGVTKIDGIGTQMHINYYMNAATQKSKEDHIVKMLELMAATGKLVRITELDMGICDENGNAIKTADVTFEQHKLMAEHYKWIIKKYFEIIPVGQQYGICQWAQTDSPESSGWRGGEPIGLWNIDFQRKPAYGGFADGLKED